jgi:hypothetical protein
LHAEPRVSGAERFKKVEHSFRAVWSEATGIKDKRRKADHAPSGVQQEQKNLGSSHTLKRFGAKRQKSKGAEVGSR